MGRTFSKALRFLVGVASIALMLRFMGVTWADVTYFVSEAVKSSLEILQLFKGSYTLISTTNLGVEWC